MNWLNILLRLIEKCIMGCLPNPDDARDYVYRTTVSQKAEVDLEPFLPKVLYQGSAPSCVAHGVAHAIAIEERIRGLRSSIPSRRWIYYFARALHNAVRTPLGGTYIRHALKSIRRLGCPRESVCKYSTSAKNLNKRPTGKMAIAASSRMGITYEWIKSQSGADIRKALSSNHPVIFGVKVGDSLRKYKKGQVLGIPQSTDGGHCMCIVGYRHGASGWEYKVLNSWRGREIVWFKEAYIEWSGAHDFAVITGWEKVA